MRAGHDHASRALLQGGGGNRKEGFTSYSESTSLLRGGDPAHDETRIVL